VERRRHMVRLWLTMDERRPLADGFAPHSGYGAKDRIELSLQSGALQSGALQSGALQSAN
jgi:hypothetical protein